MIAIATAKPRPSALNFVEHLALYSAFHRDARNRVIHMAFVPVVMFSGNVFLSFVSLAPADAPLALKAVCHLGTVMSVLVGLLFAPLSLLAFALTAGRLVMLAVAAGLLSQALTFGPAVLVACLLQAIGWFALVVVGHRRYEPLVEFDGEWVDSNLYFRQGFFVANQLGRACTTYDALVQFCMGPCAVNYDFWLGLCARLGRPLRFQHILEAQCQRVMQRLRAGMTPFD